MKPGRKPTPLPAAAILRTLRETGSYTAAAAVAGVTTRTLARSADRDTEWGAAMRAAYEEGHDAAAGITDAAHETYPRFSGSVARHGTHSGWRRHGELGERPCDPCFAAKREYDKRRREDPAKLQRSRLNARAQHHAMSALARRHKAEYDVLYSEAKAVIFGVSA